MSKKSWLFVVVFSRMAYWLFWRIMTCCSCEPVINVSAVKCILINMGLAPICWLDYFSVVWLPTIVSVLYNLTRALISWVEFFIRLRVILEGQNITLWANDWCFGSRSDYWRHLAVGWLCQAFEDIILSSVSACFAWKQMTSFLWIPRFQFELNIFILGRNLTSWTNHTLSLTHTVIKPCT